MGTIDQWSGMARVAIAGKSAVAQVNEVSVKKWAQGVKDCRMLIWEAAGTTPGVAIEKMASMVNQAEDTPFVVIATDEPLPGKKRLEFFNRFKHPELVEFVSLPADAEVAFWKGARVTLARRNEKQTDRTRADSVGRISFEVGISESLPNAYRSAALAGMAQAMVSVDLSLPSDSDAPRTPSLPDAPSNLRLIDVTLGDWQAALKRLFADGAESEPLRFPPRTSALDEVEEVLAATRDLRVANGKLSAERIAEVYGVTVSKLARWLGKTKQAVGKTPDASSLQSSLEFFERIARLRTKTENDEEFRKWLHTPNPTLGKRKPLDLIESRNWQALADKVDDMLTGAPT
ncbi:MAG TPA: antitoxin Xre/MbcA/ParS toxin-binding domain-containing protein [Candidatus Limnocylindria bacterium]|nr:antitoxin Xre/MbcA/ParS toxin-binding domain-containing protein [Candidatus Limnocylindria bacterium]